MVCPGLLGAGAVLAAGFCDAGLGEGAVVFRHRDLGQCPASGFDRVGIVGAGSRRGGAGVFRAVFGLYGGGVRGRPPSDRFLLVACESAVVALAVAHRGGDFHGRTVVAAVAGHGVWGSGDGGGNGAVLAGPGGTDWQGSSDCPGGLSGAGDAMGMRDIRG